MVNPDTFLPPLRHRNLQLWIGLPLSIIIIAAAVFSTFLMWAPHRLHYAVSGGEVVITSGALPFERQRRAPLSAVTRIDVRDVGPGRKVYGTNMPGYCAGVFRYPELGRVWQATDCSHEVVVLWVTGEELPIMVTPSQRERFLESLAGDLVFDGGADTSPGDPGWMVFRAVLPLISLVVAWIIPVVVVLGPTRLRYRIMADHLEVRTILRARTFPLAGCTVRRHRPKVSLRWWGTAMPGYYTGLFRADGTATRVYATNIGHGILVEGPELRLFINPERSEVFLEMLRSRTSVKIEG